MQFFLSPSDASRPFLTWQGIIDWSKNHYRDRLFHKDELIPVRPGLLYLVQKGAIRLVSITQNDPVGQKITEQDKTEETFLGFVGAGYPFEVVAQKPFSLQIYAHTSPTIVVWMYWQDLDNWPHFRREVLESFRYQHQRKLLWLSVLGQKRTVDRLLGFLYLLMEEYGQRCDRGYYLPYPITHAQIGSAIGSTRVTVTRLIGKLRKEGLIFSEGDNLIGIPFP